MPFLGVGIFNKKSVFFCNICVNVCHKCKVALAIWPSTSVRYFRLLLGHLIFSNLQNTNFQNMPRKKTISNLNITSSILHEKTKQNQFKILFTNIHYWYRVTCRTPICNIYLKCQPSVILRYCHLFVNKAKEKNDSKHFLCNCQIF